MRVSGPEGAALLERIGDLNRRRFLPLIERLLDEFDRPGEVVRIDRLAIDLGRIDIEDVAGIEARLARELRRALTAAVGRAPFDGMAADTLPAERVSEHRALIDDFEHYLLHGAWPYGAGIDPATRPAACLARLLADDPAALVAMLRRRGRFEPLVARLARQIPGAQLEQLLHRLEPAHAAYVIGYLGEVRASHRVTPVIAATPEALDQLMWTVVLRDALRDAGLRANRKAFLRRLLGQLSEGGHVPVAALLLQLRRGLRKLPEGHRQAGSLVELLGELAGEESAPLAGDLAIAELAELLARPSSRNTRRLRPLLAQAARTQRIALAWLLRRFARADAVALLRSVEGALPFAEALALVGGDPAAAKAVGSDTERAALLRIAAARGEGSAAPAAIGDAIEMLALAIDAEAVDSAQLSLAVERARRADAIGMRMLLRDLAAADPVRFRRRLAPALGEAELMAHLLPPALAEPLAWLAVAAGCDVSDRAALLAMVAGASDATLPEVLLQRGIEALARRRGGSAAALRRRIARAPGPSAVLLRALRGDGLEQAVSRHAALDTFASLWSGALPLTPSQGAEALARLLPALRGIAPAELRARLRAEGDRVPAALLARLPQSQLDRLMLLLAPRERRELLRGGRAAQLAALPGLIADTPSVPPPMLTAPVREALAAGLRRLSDAALARMIRTLAPRAYPAPGPRWRVALDLIARAAAGEGDAPSTLRRALAAAALRQDDALRLAEALAPRDVERMLVLLAPSGSGERAAIRRRLRTASDRRAAARRLVATLLAGAPVAAETPLSERRWAALLRTRPIEALARTSALPTGGLEALDLAALPRGERERAAALARLLTSAAGRAAIPASLAVRALAEAVAAGKGHGFVRQWAAALLRLASPSQRNALGRLLAPLEIVPGTKPAPAADAARLLHERPAGAASRLRAMARDPRRRAQLAAELGEADLMRLLALLLPAGAVALAHAGERLWRARMAAGASLPRAALRRTLIAAAAEGSGDVTRLVASLIDGGAEGIAPSSAPQRERIERALAATLEGARDAPLRAALAVRERATRKARVADPVPAEPLDPAGAIRIANAGLVLGSAFLPQFFQTLGYVAIDASAKLAWTDPAHRDRAVHLLQWLADGRCDAPEPQLALNKILCGIDPSEPVDPAIELTEAELSACRSLVGAILGNWPPLQSSSPEALRETFLQREGRLVPSEEGWTLDVERKVVDILIDHLPWGYSTIRHGWMRGTLSVNWM